MKKSSLLLVILTFLFSGILSAEISVISPVKGTWANKQMLVIETTAGSGDYFYSIDGSDPQKFGFAYDGPVLLDVTGNVKVQIAKIQKDGSTELTSVSYTVIPSSGENTDYKGFISIFYESGILNYSSGSRIQIPGNLQYSLGLPPDSFIPGQVISIANYNVLSRYIPCTILDPAHDVKWRFIIKTFPQTAGAAAYREVPFTVNNWETITFTNPNLLYKIDSEFWTLPTEERKLDRTKSHMIFWQPLDYSADNAVEFFVLPPKPRIIKKQYDDGSMRFSIKGDESYTLSILSPESGNYQEQFPAVGVDVFYGDKISEKITIGVFTNSVYQGKVTTTVEIDKRPPVQPEIESSARAFYSRDSVRVEVSAEKGADLYVALSQPYAIKKTNAIYTANNEVFQNIPLGEFRKTKSNSFNIKWNPRGSGATYYKLQAYAKSGNNISLISEYSIIIDQSSYYFDKDAESSIAEGTALHPFTDFEQCQELLNSVRSVNLRLKGQMKIDKAYSVGANLQIINDGGASILFGPKGSLEVKGASLDISNCRITNSASNEVSTIIPMIKLENAVCNLKNCELSADFSKNGTVIDSYNSILNISDLIASANAVSYVAFISAVKSRMKINNSVLAVSADTAALVSASEGTFEAVKNSFSVTGRTGRIAELFGVRAKITDNKFRGNFTDYTSVPEALFAAKDTVLYQSNNETLGF
ncbi:MAG: chitobiase/beta-hexosaminidase C-terminal domain-containing protein [Treponema sp.]|nr:chitobiase/beta-hexosaminidase C-terminal domain-containing protein [Treponema sp.]